MKILASRQQGKSETMRQQMGMDLAKKQIFDLRAVKSTHHAERDEELPSRTLLHFMAVYNNLRLQDQIGNELFNNGVIAHTDTDYLFLHTHRGHGGPCIIRKSAVKRAYERMRSEYEHHRGLSARLPNPMPLSPQRTVMRRFFEICVLHNLHILVGYPAIV